MDCISFTKQNVLAEKKILHIIKLLIWWIAQEVIFNSLETKGCCHIHDHSLAVYKVGIISPTHIYHPTELVQDQRLIIYNQEVPTNEGVDDQTD